MAGMKPVPPPSGPHIDDPLELLLACHDKIRRFTDLAMRLRGHVAACYIGSSRSGQTGAPPDGAGAGGAK